MTGTNYKIEAQTDTYSDVTFRAQTIIRIFVGVYHDNPRDDTPISRMRIRSREFGTGTFTV